MKNILIIVLICFMFSCKNETFKNWEKTSDGFYQKVTIPYKKHYKRVDIVKEDTLNGTFKIYDVLNRNTLRAKGEFKNGKTFGNFYEYDSKERLNQYSFIWDDCDSCGILPSAHYFVKYDSLGKQKDFGGKAIIDWDIDNTTIRLSDSLQLNILLATPPYFTTNLVVLDKDTKKKLKIISNPKNENNINIGFSTTGAKQLEIQYRLIQVDSPTGMISTAEFDNINVIE